MLFGRSELGADYERLVVAQGPGGLRAIVAVHSTRLGPAFGGIRRRRYRNEDAALSEVLGLASSMSYKCALAGVNAGGAKTVVLDHDDFEVDDGYAALGRIVESLGGDYVCGPDIGTGDAELARVRTGTAHVNPEGNDAGASTAAGVMAALRGVLRVIVGDVELSGHHFAVQGLGSVGLALARTLREAGATVTGADPDPAARRAGAELGVQIVDVDALFGVPCDVLMPCALGRVLDRDTAARVVCRAICGSANGQLADADASAVLQSRGIVHVPDSVTSAGAVIEGVITVREGQGPGARDRVRETIERIEDTTRSILDDARHSGRAPSDIAIARAQAIIAAG